MTHKELRRFVNSHEYNMISGEYFSLDLGDDTYYGDSSNTNYAFMVHSYLGYNTFLICKGSLLDGNRDFEINKVIFISREFETFEFETFDKFLEFIPTLDYVKEIHVSK